MADPEGEQGRADGEGRAAPEEQGDRTPFGVEVMKRVASPRVKLLYDIFHMQMMEGDIISTIPDGDYKFHDYMEGDVVPGGSPIRINLTLKVRGDDITFDFEGTALRDCPGPFGSG